MTHVAGEMVLHATEAAAIGLGGKSAVLMIGGETVAYWAGPVLGVLYVLDLDQHTGQALTAMGRVAYTKDLLREAEAMQYALENPDARTMSEEYLDALERALGRGCYPITEDFDTASLFTQTSNSVVVRDGQAQFDVCRDGGQQFIHRAIQAFSGDVKITVIGRMSSANNNCGSLWASGMASAREASG